VEGVAYLVCAATAFICALLLLRTYRRTRTRLLLWCGLCFLFLTVDNAALFIDMIVFPDIDLSGLHLSAGLVAVLLLLYGLIWEAPLR
jgi:hypothetical protein